ncbi:MAG: SidA/IucD/PvdA family monooxygenase [Streptosporangiales bacterium]|nr:SidA/IucD/PvdA family monooxygenase [Streptosporangiales bacterium]
MSTDTYDVVGVGIGPFNLALAALADPLGLRAAFFERDDTFRWHPGMLIEGTTLQVPFLADLVTLVDPTSRWSFLSYLRAHDRLFPFYFAERFHVSRHEYEDYCRWVATALPSCRFGSTVDSVRWDGTAFTVTAGGTSVRAANVVLGVGAEPTVPDPLRPLLGDDVFHAAEYLPRADTLDGASDVTVVGSGQSGAEVFLDLLRRGSRSGTRLRWLTSSPAFAPMEYSKLGLEHFTPAYTEYFRSLDRGTRDDLVPAQWQLHKAISAETIAEIHDVLYERLVAGTEPAPQLLPNAEVVTADRHGSRIELGCRHLQRDEEFGVTTDKVVLATGYGSDVPTCLTPMAALIRWDDRGRFAVDGDYRVAADPAVTGGLYVQNAELHTHGVGTPDLGLGAHRAAVILNAITGRQAYRLPPPDRTAFTTFGTPPP